MCALVLIVSVVINFGHCYAGSNKALSPLTFSLSCVVAMLV